MKGVKGEALGLAFSPDSSYPGLFDVLNHLIPPYTPWWVQKAKQQVETRIRRGWYGRARYV